MAYDVDRRRDPAPIHSQIDALSRKLARQDATIATFCTRDGDTMRTSFEWLPCIARHDAGQQRVGRSIRPTPL